MPEIISSIVKSIESAMEKYGFWRVAFLISIIFFIWKLPDLVQAFRWW